MGPASRHLPPNWFLHSRLKLRHLQVLVALYTHRKLHLAADSLGLSQPAASKLLGELVAALGEPLFARKGRGLEPTELGLILTRRAKAILSELDGTRDEVNALQDGHLGRVAIGSIDAPAIELLTPAVADAQRLHPRLEIEIQAGSSNVLLERLVAGQLDIVLGRPMTDYDHGLCRYREIGIERLSLVGRRGHPLSGGATLRIDELRDQAWVLQARGSILRRRVEDMFHDAGAPLPERVISTNSLLMTLSYLTQTDALSVISEPAARQQARCGQIEILAFEHQLSTGAYGVILPVHRAPTAAVGLILRLLEERSPGARALVPQPVT